MKVSEILREFIAHHQESEITIRAMVTYFGERAFGFLLLVFALICIIPLPIPGIHMFLAIPLFYLSVQQMAGRHQVWFPDKVLDYKIPRRAFEDISAKAIPWIMRIEKISKPRLEFLTRGWCFCLFGALTFYITAFLSIPLPLTNLVPAIGISLIAIGFLNRDGLALIIGAVIGILWSWLWFIVGVSGLIYFFKHAVLFFN